ncbi:MAG: P1 family peptidase [Actinobacteria bacterium]|nr:P1 family peptidase [Actinomycetota bacterium]
MTGEASPWYRRIGSHRAGAFDAITDVAGVAVGHTTLIEGHGRREVGVGPVRTGVTVVVPSVDVWHRPLPAGAHRINGAGEVSGLEWIRESGLLTTPIGLTNTHSLGVVRDAIARRHVRENPDQLFSLPVVGETCDVLLNDMNGQHVRAEHLESALAASGSGPVEQGSVGGGTGMICHDFKGGIGTASRLVDLPGAAEQWTVGVLVQANHGVRHRLTIDGVPVGQVLDGDLIPLADWGSLITTPGQGSIIVVIATDAPLLAPECTALAQRATFGIARTGGAGERDSGDFAVAFSTAGDVPGSAQEQIVVSRRVQEHLLSQIYWAAIEATEQAIVNSMLAAETMTGADDKVVYELPTAALDELDPGRPR